MGDTYPQRGGFFANRYCRLLTKSCAAQELGHVAFTLCVVVAHTEDAKRYTGHVTFFNEQLMPLIGVTKWKALDRARKVAVECGWLHYVPGNRGKRQPGRYWVTIPSGLSILDDSPCDEDANVPETDNGCRGSNVPQEVNGCQPNLPSNTPEEDIGCESQSPTQCTPKGNRGGDRGGEPSNLSLFPIPEDTCAQPSGPPEGESYTVSFEAWWSHYPRKVGKRKAAASYAKAASRVGHEALLEAVKAFSKSDKGTGDFCPYPETWLNQGRYEDDPKEWSDQNRAPRQRCATKEELKQWTP